MQKKCPDKIRKLQSNVKVRYAPSPTGDPHIGNIRTALFNWLFSRHHNGEFILRIEDTDQARLVPGSLERILESLEWLGLDYNNKLQINSKSQIPNSKQYIQSHRLEIYQKYAQELLDKKQAYKCFCTSERLKKMRKEQIAKGLAPMYDGKCRSRVSLRGVLEAIPSEKGSAIQSEAEDRQNEKYIIRLKVPKQGKTEFEDLIRGKVSFENKLIDDQVLLKSDGWPTYHLASVIDDHLMKITHVIRGEEWLSSTSKHLLLYQAFGWQPPKFAHLPIVLGSDKSKLSKRHGALSILEYRDQGYLPEALINFMALLGWNPGRSECKSEWSVRQSETESDFDKDKEQEIFTRQELIKKFSLDRVQKSGAIFNPEKLDWMNGYYIRQMDLDALTEKCIPYLSSLSLRGGFLVGARDRLRNSVTYDYVKKVVALEQERMKKLSEISELASFFFIDKLDYNPELLRWKKQNNQEIAKNLTLAEKELGKIKEKDFTREKIEKVLMKITKQTGTGEILWPFRVALTGRKVSPGPFEVAEVLGKGKVIKKVKEAIRLISKNKEN
jgi:glutamyl-tRNA synthetase